MVNDRPTSVASVARIDRGLYLLRYVESLSDPQPIATLRSIDGPVEFMSAPGQEAGLLTRPGQVTVIVARGDAAFELRVSPNPRGGDGTDASFKLELLDKGVETRSTDPEHGLSDVFDQHRPLDRSAEDVRLKLLAHVSRRGDVEAGAGEWIAGPDEVLPIEGLAIATDRPDVTIALRVQAARGGSQWSRWHSNGEFAGSRQKADPLIALALDLRGERAADYVLAAESMALGSPPQRKVGRMVEFSGFDAIVGFRLSLNPVKVSNMLQVGQVPARVRVFRAKR